MSRSTPDPEPLSTPDASAAATAVDRADVGYQHTLSNLQVQMIAIGSAIGTGLFLGVGSRLAAAGPGLLVSYFIVAVVVYLMMRALGEMVVYRPTTGAWISYAREFVGDRFAHLTGWINVTLGSLIGGAEAAAVAVYVQYWLPNIPGWIPSLLALLLIVGSNLLTVHAFANVEFAATAVKVLAIIAFVAAGVIIVVLSATSGLDPQASFAHLWGSGGFFPNGLLPVILVMQGVVFSFSGVELVGIAAGEAKDPARTMPKAIRSVIFRIAVFYLGSIAILAMLLPWDRYSGKESPFVTALASLNIPGLAGIMNFVVLTAALSAVNATLYASSRLLRDLAANGSAPRATAAISRRGVPFVSLLSIGGVYFVCLLLILLAGASDAFEIILGACAVFVLFGWVAIFVAHLGFRRHVDAGRIAQPAFRMPGSPATDWICLVALALVFLSLIFNFSDPHWYYNLIAAVVLVGVHLLTYEYFSRRRARAGLPDVEPGHHP